MNRRWNRSRRRWLVGEAGDVLLVLRFSAFVAEAGILGKDGAARTAFLHTFSLRLLGFSFSEHSRVVAKMTTSVDAQAESPDYLPA